MDFNRLAIAIRPRSPWQAVDLGLLMARRWWLPLLIIWLLVTLPLFILSALLPVKYVLWQIVILWWLKPLFERPLLHFLSRAVFGDIISVVSAVRAFPSLALKQVLLSLTWRRLSANRAMDLPVLQLEGLSGAARKTRLLVLHREDAAPSGWLTMIGAHVEAFIMFALIALVMMFVPQTIDIGFDDLQALQERATTERWVILANNMLAYIAYALVAPFYVASGFSLYLNRRIRLEAWDIEIAFRRIVANHQPKKTNAVTPLKSWVTLCVLVGFVSIVMAGSPSVQAQNERAFEPSMQKKHTIDSMAPAELTAQDSKHLIANIKAGEKFHQMEVVKYPDIDWPQWHFDQKQKRQPWQLPDWLAVIPSLFEILLWLIVITVIGFVIYRYRYWLMEFSRGLPRDRARARIAPETMFGLDLRPESLPNDMSSAAIALWENGERRECLALLYRASLVQIIRHGVLIEAQHTERECLRKVQQQWPEIIQGKISTPACEGVAQQVTYFEQLTKIWRNLAYAHRDPDESVALHLCRQWQQTWLVLPLDKVRAEVESSTVSEDNR